MKKIEITGYIHREAHYLGEIIVYTEAQPLHAYNQRRFQNKVTVTVELSDEEFNENKKRK